MSHRRLDTTMLCTAVYDQALRCHYAAAMARLQARLGSSPDRELWGPTIEAVFQTETENGRRPRTEHCRQLHVSDEARRPGCLIERGRGRLFLLPLVFAQTVVAIAHLATSWVFHSSGYFSPGPPRLLFGSYQEGIATRRRPAIQITGTASAISLRIAV
jgi:hypothetical protein